MVMHYALIMVLGLSRMTILCYDEMRARRRSTGELQPHHEYNARQSFITVACRNCQWQSKSPDSTGNCADGALSWLTLAMLRRTLPGHFTSADQKSIHSPILTSGCSNKGKTHNQNKTTHMKWWFWTGMARNMFIWCSVRKALFIDMLMLLESIVAFLLVDLLRIKVNQAFGRVSKAF